MPRAPFHTLRQRLADRLLTTDPTQRLRLAQSGLAMVLMALSVVILVYAARLAGTPAPAVAAWAALSLGGMVVFFAAIRFGWSRGFVDPSLTVVQMVFAITSGAIAYAMAGPMRGATFVVLLAILMFGMFQLRPRALWRVSLYALGLFGTVMAVMAWRQPQVYRPAVELGHFLMLAATLPAVSLLAGRLTALRERSRHQRRDLAEALARIQALAMRDELTGLINRRHMLELLEQERQRCVRSGRTFCVAMIDIDRFKDVNDRYGHAAGDEVLQRLAREALSAVRVADVLARWGGDEFVLLLSDARLQLARGGVERVRQRIEAVSLRVGEQALQVTISAGLAEHIAGESVATALARADAALYEAKAQGRNRTVAADGSGAP
jgi:diguanylate cyclase (GGDEF)-like protein